MDYKILLADDSPTIQKVVKITLASEPYQIEECVEAGQITKKLSEFRPHIVLLDFNLSEDKTGYQLAQEIYNESPGTKIMMLFGTFDTIDDEQLKANHVSAKIVKPFDGTKFINTCRSLIEEVLDNNDTLLNRTSKEVSDDDLPSVIEEGSSSFSMDETEDDWVINQPDIIEEENETIHLPEENEMNPLDKEAMDWGMGVPGVIGEESPEESLDIPDVISFELPEKEEAEYPDNDDLDYPDVIEISEKIEAEETQDFSSEGPLISIEEMQEAENENGTTREEDIERLQAQIADETEEDLWSADVEEESAEKSFPEKNDQELLEEEFLEEEIFSSDDKEEDEYDLDRTLEEQMDDDFPEVIPHKLEAVTDQYEAPKEVSSFEVPEDMAEKIFERMKPIIEEEIRKYCKEMVEKVAWEVIPDLAENLIKKQIEKITDDVLNSD